MAGPLEGIRILDLTQVLFGPFATMILSDLSVEVIKVEWPEVGGNALKVSQGSLSTAG